MYYLFDPETLEYLGESDTKTVFSTIIKPTSDNLIFDRIHKTWSEKPVVEIPPPVYTCSAWQIRKALNNQNLRQAVEDAVLASTDQDLKDGWNFAGSFDSNNPFVLAMGQAIGKSEQETIDLIQYASTL